MQQVADAEVASSLARDMAAGCVGVRIGRLHRLVVREFERQLLPLGLSLQQLEMLSTLTLCGEAVKPSAIADLLAVERSTMSRNLAVLQERGFVRSTEVSATGRSLAVTITAAGTAKLGAASTAWTQAQANLTTPLGPGVPATLDSWLRALSGDGT